MRSLRSHRVLSTYGLGEDKGAGAEHPSWDCLPLWLHLLVSGSREMTGRARLGTLLVVHEAL